MTEIMRYLRYLLALVPFILFVLLNHKANLKKPVRSRQLLMPVFALIYCILILVFLTRINGWITSFLFWIPGFLARAARWLGSLWDGRLAAVADLIRRLAAFIETFVMRRTDLSFILFFIENTAFLLVHIILKKIVLVFLKRICKPGKQLYEKVAGLFYDHDEGMEDWYIRNHFGQARTFLKSAYYATAVITIIAGLISFRLYRAGWLSNLFFPVFGIIIIGEVYFFLDGLTRQEMEQEFEEEKTEAGEGIELRRLRDVLRRLFSDKLTAEDTTVSAGMDRVKSNDEMLSEFEESEDRKLETYGRFMRLKTQRGLELDQNYLLSGRDLLEGKSILFNNPFYYDLIPYIFYPMNHVLLTHHKILIILGRHETEEDAMQWCQEGLTDVTNVPDLWNIGILNENEQKNLHVGIVTRSSVHDLKLHEANKEFFAQVGFVILMEPSRLITTAQVGLNSLVRYCREGGQPVTYCSMDKNCDGLLDALSHILMTSLTEVAATNRHDGVSSYMLWSPDTDYLQHRMLPHISRYLGVGTEMAFVGLKNQVNRADWYGGDAFPVVDMHWISRQYYYDLLKYANRPTVQEGMDQYFHTTPNLWNAKAEEDHYMIVEDEAFNMFEVRRDFATRAKKQGFVNVISSDYLLRDYMADNNGIFCTDPKAIPYIVADYAHTERNVVLRLCLRMSVDDVPEEDILRELLLIGVNTQDPTESLWHLLCQCYHGENIQVDKEEHELLQVQYEGEELTFTSEVIVPKRKYSFTTGRMENMYHIRNPHFVEAVLGDLQNAGYIAEDEKGDHQYLGTELRGMVFQKYLPGQFFTLGGKYYEMLRLTPDGRVMVRRAADHITGRPLYRQVRSYELSNIRDSQTMGDQIDISGLRITRQFADITVKTPSYWENPTYNDFEKGRLVSVNGVPERKYRSKQVLRVELPAEKASEAIYTTLVQLMNETFRTLFAENQDFIVAVCPGEAKAPVTYSLAIEDEAPCFYIIEDSQLDLGLLEAVKRNLKRIFSIVCDYLDWHTDTLAKSLNPEPETPPVIPPLPEPEEGEAEPEKKKGFFRRLFGAIANFFKKIWQAIKNFFRKIFKRKKKGEEPENPEAPQNPEGTEEGVTPAEEQEPFAGPEEIAPEAPEATETPEIATEEPEAAETPETVTEEPQAPETEVPAEAEPAAPEEHTESENKTLGSVSYRALYDIEDDPDGIDDAPENPTEASDVDGDLVEFEPEKVMTPVESRERKPYHERYYLLYGGKQVPEHLDVAGTLQFLKDLGFGDNELKQAREGKDIADLVGRTFVPNRAGSHYCDFCGAELIGNEYERLEDGRERCLNCAQTSIKSAQEFNALYREVVRNLDIFFGVKITVPVHVEMVNAKKLHKKLKKRFVPTGNSDGRVLGVAIRQGDSYNILLENGAPRLSSIMTMAHEMTHIWQYLNWNDKGIQKLYGKDKELDIYEGMAKWTEIQYAYLIGEPATAKREEIITLARADEYGRGFRLYLEKYPLTTGNSLTGKKTPFTNKEKPL